MSSNELKSEALRFYNEDEDSFDKNDHTCSPFYCLCFWMNLKSNSKDRSNKIKIQVLNSELNEFNERLEKILQHEDTDYNNISDFIKLEFKLLSKSIILTGLCELIAGILLIISMIVIAPKLLLYDIIDSESFVLWIVLPLTVMICEILQSYFITISGNRSLNSGFALNRSLVSILFKKILIAKSFENISNEKMLTLITKNINLLLFSSVAVYSSIPKLIILLCLTIVYSFIILKFWAFLSCGLLLLGYWIQIHLQSRKSQCTEIALTFADKWVNYVASIKTVIKQIKMQNWEMLVFNTVFGFRKLELIYLKKKLLLHTIIDSLVIWIPLITYSVTFLGCFYTQTIIPISSVFLLVILYNRLSYTCLELSKNCLKVSHSYKNFKQIQTFLKLGTSFSTTSDSPPFENFPIILSNVVLSQDNIESIDQNNEDESAEILTRNNEGQAKFLNFNFKMPKGKLYGIYGKHGSGKTTLLLTILGEVKIISGERNITGTIGYLSQNSFLFPGTIKENITFGLPFSDERYSRCVFASTLTSDLRDFPSGDNTSISDSIRSNNELCKKICLARTLYKDSDIYLLDEPFLNLNKDIIQHFINYGLRDLLREKTILIVTDKFIEICDQILYICNGTILETGTHEELLNLGGDYADLKESETEMEVEPIKNSISKDTFILENNTTQDVTEEKKDEKTSKYLTKDYFKHSSLVLVILTLLTFVIHQISACFVLSWFGEWLEDDGNDMNSTNNYTKISLSQKSQELLDYYALPLGIVVATLIAIAFLRIWFSLKLFISLSRRIHKKFIRKLMQSSLQFIHRLYVLKTVDNFFANLKLVDYQLPEALFSYWNHFFIYWGCWIQICVIQPYITLVLGCLILIYAFTLKHLKIKLILFIKAQNLSFCSLKDWITAICPGFLTIKSYQNETFFLNKFQLLLNQYLTNQLTTEVVKQWFLFVLNLLSIIAVTGSWFILLWINEDISEADVGVVITASYLIISCHNTFLKFDWRFIGRFPNITDLKQLIQKIPSEENHTDKVLNHPQKNWPEDGGILYQKVNADDPETGAEIKDISVMIKPKQVIAIVGKSDIEKSLMIDTLFQVAPNLTGKIFIDGVDISTIYLKDSRSKMVVMLKECFLLPGTIRHNLDPFNHHEDPDIWITLEKIHLKQWVKNKDNKLETLVDNESIEFKYRQLICLGRIILQKVKIVALDLSQEETNDNLIKIILRTELYKSTLILISNNIQLLQMCAFHVSVDSNQIPADDIPASSAAEGTCRILMN